MQYPKANIWISVVICGLIIGLPWYMVLDNTGMIDKVTYDKRNSYSDSAEHSIDTRNLYLKYGVFDPLNDKGVLKGIGSRDDFSTRYYIVQLKTRSYDTFRQYVSKVGAEIEGYIPDGAYLMYIPEDAYANINNINDVRTIIPYYPEFKISPDIYNKDTNFVDIRIVLHDFVYVPPIVREKSFNDLCLFEDRSLVPTLNINAKRAVLSSLAKYVYSIGGEVKRFEHDAMVATVPKNAVYDIAAMDPVEWIEPYLPQKLTMDNVRAINNLDYIQSNYGYTGNNVIVGVADTGCDTTHPDLQPSSSKIVAYLYDNYYPPGDNEGHGTCTAGIIAATGANNANAKGMAPDAGLLIQETIGSNVGLYTIFEDANNYYVNVHSNSWGSAGYSYDSQSQIVDNAVFTYGYTICFAAGNEGPQSGTISSEAQAKNTIAVGAVYDYNSPNIGDHEMADFSSRGPASDGRIKPDIVATGAGIYTIDMVGNAGYTSGDYTDGYQYFGGTSGATPIVAGAAAVTFEAYKDDFFGNNPTHSNASAAVIKALLINSAEPLDGYSYTPTTYGWYAQGWGELCLENMFSRTYFIQDESDTYALSTGQTATFHVAATGTDDLRITLVWTDVPGSPSAANALVNDLDLEVVGPDNNIYLGNVFNGVYSTTGGSPDRINNVECVYLNNPVGGLYTIRVKGYDVPDGPQRFALVVSGVATGMGILYLDKKYYNAGDTPRISYSDWDYKDGLSGGTISVTVKSEANPTGISITLTENGDSGFFEGTFSWSDLGVNHYDNISVTYTDTNPITRVLYANATYDDVPPIISNFRISGLGRQYVLLSWETNEKSRSAVFLKKSGWTDFVEITPNSIEWFPWQSPDYDYDQYVKDHVMFISGLEPNTIYYLYVASFDRCNNGVFEDNSNNYYIIKTMPAQNIDILLIADDGSGVYGTAARIDEYYLRNLDLVYDFHRRATGAPPSLTNYDIVIWECGYEITGTLNNSASPDGVNDQEIISNYFNNGGRFILSGMNVAWDAFEDLSANVPNDITFSNFYRTYFHATYRFYDVLKNSQQPYTTMSGISGDPISGDYTGNNKIVVYPAQYCDEIGPYNNGIEVFKWDNTGNTSVVRWEGNYKVVTFSLMIPAIYYTSQAISVFYKAMNYLISFPEDTYISGYVIDKYGEGVAGARVIVYSNGDRTTILGIDYTNMSGGYYIPKLGPGTYDVVGHKDGYQDGEVIAVTLAANGQLEDINITLDSGSISGYVVDQGNIGLANVTIWVMKNGTKTPVRSDLTDDTGFFRVTGLETGSYDILAFKESYIPTYIYNYVYVSGNDDILNNITMVSARARILLVADDKDAGFLPIIYEPLFIANGYLYDTWSTTTQGTPPQTKLDDYSLVVWLNGQTYDSNTLSSGEQTALQTYLDNGGNLWLIGMDTLYDSALSPQNSTFVKNYLHVIDVDKDKGVRDTLYGIDGDPIGNGAMYDITDPYNIGDYSDAITPDTSATPVFYQDKDKETYSAIKYSGNYKTLFFAFEVALIRTFEERVDIVHRAVEWFAPPPPEINTPPVLTDGMVSPSQGNFSVSFKFTVTYTDADNNAPEYVKLYIDNQKVYTMTPAQGNDGDYTNGEIYEYTLNGNQIGSGNHTFRFEATDGAAIAIGSNLTYHGPFINNPPVLQYPKVTPTTGTTEEVFRFSVVYKDIDNDPPVSGSPMLYMDGSSVPYSMIIDQSATSAYRDGDYTNGEKYIYETTLDAGSHTFYFTVSDGYLSYITDTIKGPDVSTPGNSPPTLYDYSVSPTSGNVGGTYEYRVWYKDADEDPPAYIRVYIDLQPYDMKQVDPSDVTYSDGKEYSFTIVINDTGTHEYYFEASDGIDTVTTSTVPGPAVSSPGNKVPQLYDAVVEPISGTTSTVFKFRVTYKDDDNDPPVNGGPELYIDGNKIGVMTLDSSADASLRDGMYINGERYVYETTLSAGSHTYYFFVGDGKDYETTVIYQGPRVGSEGNNVSELRNGRVSPTIGGLNTTYRFSVVYIDKDNQPPAYIRVVIDSTPYDMILDSGAVDIYKDGDYTNGELYYFETTLTSGEHKYHFEASDGIDPVVWPIIDATGPYVSSPPILTDIGFSPSIGTPETEFEFYATYIDSDGDMPEYVRLYIGTFEIDMEKMEGDDYTVGVVYKATGITLPAAKDYTYYITTTDGYNTEIISQIIDGPIVDTPPVLSDGHVVPEGGTTNDSFVFYVTYSDADGDAPKYVRVIIDNDANYNMSPEDSNIDYVEGVVYSSDPIALPVGTHTFRFEAADEYFSAIGDIDNHTGLEIVTGGTSNGGDNVGNGNLPPTPEFDKDGDQINDSWEINYGFDPTDPKDALEDSDGDGLSNLEEFMYGTDPLDKDSDNDGLSDGEEIKIYHTDPMNSDSDSDGMDDGWEVRYGLNPNSDDASEDMDNDGYSNLEEYEKGTDPTKSNAISKETKAPGTNDMLIWLVILIAIIVIAISLAIFFIVVKSTGTKEKDTEVPAIIPEPSEELGGQQLEPQQRTERPMPRIVPETVEWEVLPEGIEERGELKAISIEMDSMAIPPEPSEMPKDRGPERPTIRVMAHRIKEDAAAVEATKSQDVGERKVLKVVKRPPMEQGDKSGSIDEFDTLFEEPIDSVDDEFEDIFDIQ